MNKNENNAKNERYEYRYISYTNNAEGRTGLPEARLLVVGGKEIHPRILRKRKAMWKG